ncbi:MAG: hypothetical protein NDI90_15505 [Nitrospira sp. BO4]|jgi:hypothetical protein|nr:hypothetical protein [Nitrospira sp. BO4]
MNTPQLNRHGLPFIGPRQRRRRPQVEPPFNFEGNRVYTFLAVQKYRSEQRRYAVLAQAQHPSIF